ncbi:transmembrane protein 65-like isoform X2 [Silurus meridionalis]|uniref:transmembrane protein 65-like isoform X2 n=1 Tax=Silurus meridionalis TaxID=175797 RepID=UPI001EECCAFB|nr:transmembrane protein 65-like isoform X2 [Silurus meridionalis]
MMLPCLRRVLRPALALRPSFAPVSHLGTHARKEPIDPLSSPQGARDFIYGLHPAERTCLMRELHRFESIAIAQEQLEMAPPTTAQLRYVLLHNAIPFIGFGFLDNAIMIAAGTQIELSIGVILGISTMAAAALGNLVSDLAGLGPSRCGSSKGSLALVHSGFSLVPSLNSRAILRYLRNQALFHYTIRTYFPIF